MDPIRISVKTLRQDLLGLQSRLSREHHGFVRYQVLNRVLTMLARPDFSHRVFVENAANYRRSLQHDNLALLMGYGLINSDGDIWRRQRKLTQPAFDKDLHVRVATLAAQMAHELIEKWQDGSVVDVYEQMMALTLRVIGMALFSIDLKATPVRFAEAARVGLLLSSIRSTSPVIFPLWIPTRLHRRYHELTAELDHFIYGLIDQRLRSNENNNDILGKLIEAYGDEAAASRQELRDQIVTLFIAGFETTGAALSWTWYLLSQNVEVETKFHLELATVLNGKTPDYDDLHSLHYTAQIIDESLRLYPPVYTMTRRAADKDQMGEHCINKGDNILIPLHAIHRMPEYWDQPDGFCPERFDSLTDDQRKAYQPFGGGQRKCMGANFATYEMLMVLAVIGQQVHLLLVEGHPVVPAPAVTTTPKFGLKMRVEKRSRD